MRQVHHLFRTLNGICLVIVLVAGIQANAQTPSNNNAVVSSQARTATTAPADLDNYLNAATVIQYMDGYGKPIQQVSYRATPTGLDLIGNTIRYNNFGLPVKEYLPVPQVTTNGELTLLSTTSTIGNNFYGDTRPFNEATLLDNSPLGRVKEQYGAGNTWFANGKKNVTHYETAGSDVRNYQLDGAGNINWNGTYPTNSLSKTRRVDEQGSEVIEITDKRGRLVEKRVQSSANEYLQTHYLYDGNDRFKAVIQPQGYDVGTILYNSANFTNYVFFYLYNDQGNIAQKHIPGGGWTSYIYDRIDRPVLSQTAHQLETDKWSFVKYDIFGRVVVQGELTRALGAGETLDDLQGEFLAIAAPFENRAGNGYTTVSYPSSVIHTASEQLVVNYYDSYDWIETAWAFEPVGAYNPTSQFTDVKGMMTGSFVRSTEDPLKTFHSVLYYDDKGRVMQTHQTHHKGGSGANLTNNTISTDYEYNFAGEILKEKVTYKIDGFSDTEALTTNEYDHVGRILKVFHSINGAGGQELCRYGYDEIGRLKEKIILPNGTYLYGGTPDYINRSQNPNTGIDDLAKKAITILPNTEINGTYLAMINPNAPSGSNINGLQTIDYAYHIRGGLRGMNLDGSGNAVPNASQGDLFSFKLDYETAGFYDGNIGKQTWKNDTEAQWSYVYSYDPAKRLKTAAYTGVGSEDFSIPLMSYDKNGNITNLQRKGVFNGSTYDLIDNLTYNYGSSGNRLQGVTDGVSGNTDTGDFRDNGSNNDYTYYPDGSLKSDGNKGISLIEYDTFLKKVKQVTWSDGRWLKFFYDGSGKLLKRENSLGDYWEYVGNMIFRNGQFYQMSTPDGRAVYNSSSSQWEYEFEYRDVWGNLRVAFKSENGQLVKTQSSDYDALGFEYNKFEQAQTNKFKYQKQERIDDFDLGIDMFKFRPSDYRIGRFWTIDPLSEQYVYNSPYALQENKFGLGIELEGAELQPFYPNLQAEVYRGAGFNREPTQKENWEMGKTLLQGAGLTMLAISTAVLPIEEVVLGALGIAAKEAGLGAKLLGTSTRRASAIRKMESATKGEVGEGSFIVSEKGTAASTSQSRMKKSFEDAGFESKSTRAEGIEYTMPNKNKVRLMKESGQAPRRASFENDKGNATNIDWLNVSPTRGLNRKDRLEYIRSRTHINQQ